MTIRSWSIFDYHTTDLCLEFYLDIRVFFEATMALSLLLFLLFHVLSAVVSTVKPGDVGFVEDFLELNQEADNDTIPPSTLMHTQPNPSLHPLWTRTPSDYAGVS